MNTISSLCRLGILFSSAACLFFLSLVASAAELDIFGTFEGMYDDNIHATSSNRDGDFITLVSAGMGVRHVGKVDTLNLRAEVSQNFYAINRQMSSNSQNLSLSYRHEFNPKSRLLLTNNFQHFPEPRDYADMFDRSGTNGSYVSNSFSLQHYYDLLSWVNIIASYSNSYNHYLSEEYADTNANTLSAATNLFLNSQNIVSFTGSFLHNDREEGDASKVVTGYAGYLHYFTSTLYAEGRGGVDHFQTVNGSQTTPYLFFSVQNDINDRIHTAIYLIKRSSVSVVQSDVYSSWRISALLGGYLTKRIRLNGMFFYGEGEYDVSEAGYTLLGFSFNASYDLSINLSAFVSYSHSYSKTELVDSVIQRNLYQLGVRGNF